MDLIRTFSGDCDIMGTPVANSGEPAGFCSASVDLLLISTIIYLFD
jgi:hypothetical protein